MARVIFGHELFCQRSKKACATPLVDPVANLGNSFANSRNFPCEVANFGITQEKAALS